MSIESILRRKGTDVLRAKSIGAVVVTNGKAGRSRPQHPEVTPRPAARVGRPRARYDCLDRALTTKARTSVVKSRQSSGSRDERAKPGTRCSWRTWRVNRVRQRRVEESTKPAHKVMRREGAASLLPILRAVATENLFTAIIDR